MLRNSSYDESYQKLCNNARKIFLNFYSRLERRYLVQKTLHFQSSKILFGNFHDKKYF